MKTPKTIRLAPQRLKNDAVARELVRSDEDATRNTRIPVPSTNPATNLIIAEIVVRGASTLLRRNVERRVAAASFGTEERAREVLDGRTLLTSAALYGAGKLATRSRLGLGLVTGALVAKVLYDRGRTIQLRRRRARRNSGEQD